MARPISLVLNQEQRQELVQIRDHDSRPYMRERAAALLKIADGCSGLQVAQSGLLKPRDPDTIYNWVKRYQQMGIDGLVIRAGRGRKPLPASH
jgi:transposase